MLDAARDRVVQPDTPPVNGREDEHFEHAVPTSLLSTGCVCEQTLHGNRQSVC